MQLAQFNVARLVHPIDHPAIADFVANLDRLNRMADRMDGFIWRHEGESGNSTEGLAHLDPMLLPNLSVWKDGASLDRYVFGTIHKRIYDRRHEWFEAAKEFHLVMWWIEDGAFPTIEVAMTRLEKLRREGPSEDAFGWEQLEDAKLWRSKSCGQSAA